jgi:hypothetical protein
MSGITLDPKQGVNPHLTYCPRCGGESKELILIGNRKYKTLCSNCNTMNYGSRKNEKCGRCKEQMFNAKQEEISEWEKLPATEPCDKCKEEIDQHRKIVAAGGVYVRCKTCNMKGVAIPESQAAKMTREAMKIQAPDPCGLEFENCEQHKEATDGNAN